MAELAAAGVPVQVQLPDEALQLAHALLAASQQGTISDVAGLLERDAPAWYQDDSLGWSCLHYAAERREPALLRKLLSGGAVWNAVDKWGRTAGEICLSLGDKTGWEIIRNEGVRAEMLHHALREANKLKAAEKEEMTVEPGEEGKEGAEVTQTGDGITLRNHDESSAGDNLAFLASKLTWETGEDGRERVLDADGNGVMMGWEEPLSTYTPPLVCAVECLWLADPSARTRPPHGAPRGSLNPERRLRTWHRRSSVPGDQAPVPRHHRGAPASTAAHARDGSVRLAERDCA